MGCCKSKSTIVPTHWSKSQNAGCDGMPIVKPGVGPTVYKLALIRCKPEAQLIFGIAFLLTAIALTAYPAAVCSYEDLCFTRSFSEFSWYLGAALWAYIIGGILLGSSRSTITTLVREPDAFIFTHGPRWCSRTFRLPVNQVTAVAYKKKATCPSLWSLCTDLHRQRSGCGDYGQLAIAISTSVPPKCCVIGCCGPITIMVNLEDGDPFMMDNFDGAWIA